MKLYPRVADDDDDDMPAEGGSFFNFFAIAEDPFDVSVVLLGGRGTAARVCMDGQC